MDHENSLYVTVVFEQIQDEAHALLMCRDADVCALRRKSAYLFTSQSIFRCYFSE